MRGEIEREPFAHFLYKGGSKEPPGATLCVAAHLLAVEKQKRPEEPWREPAWLDAEETKDRLAEHRSKEEFGELHRVVDAAAARLETA